MTKLQLAKLVQWAGTFGSRKRMQKVCFLLQTNGCALDLDYYLDAVGPYSQDLGQLTDEMTREGFLDEEAEGPKYHERYSYRLTSKAESKLAQVEASQGHPPS